MNAIALVAAKVTLGGSLALGLLLTPHAVAHADAPLPVCHMEDGSDVDPASLPCVWTNEGKQWLTYADHSVLIGDTPAPAFPCIPAPFIVIPGLVPGVVQCH